jgi:hypothetical protein
MRILNSDPTVEISAISGMLRVTVRPSRSWLVAICECGAILTFGIMAYRNWETMSQLYRALFVSGTLSCAAVLLFQFSGSEIIEIGSEKLTVRKGIHGWERTREYSIKECRELEWMQGAEDTPQRLQFKHGWRTVTLGEDLSENQAIEILTALQQSVPEAAQQLCSYPDGKKHFITLGLTQFPR